MPSRNPSLQYYLFEPPRYGARADLLAGSTMVYSPIEIFVSYDVPQTFSFQEHEAAQRTTDSLCVPLPKVSFVRLTRLPTLGT